MMDPDRIHRIIQLLYDASHDDALWPFVSAELSELFGGAIIVIDDNASMGGPLGLATSARFDTSLQPVHFEEYRTPESNPGLAALMRAEVGRAFPLSSFLTREHFESDPSCRDILVPQSIDKGLIVTFQRSPDTLGFMNVLGRASDDELGAQEAAAVDLIAGHLARACDLRRKVLGRRLRGTAQQRALEERGVTEGMLVVTSDGTLIDADVSGEAILQRGLGIGLRSGRVTSRSTEAGQDAEALQRFIATPPPSERPFVVREAAGVVTLVESLPLSDISLFDGKAGNRLLIVRQIAHKVAPDITGFAAVYGLSRAEIRVLSALTRAPSATAAAAELGIGRETMKTHLGRIYKKTATQTLSQLLLLVGRFS